MRKSIDFSPCVNSEMIWTAWIHCGILRMFVCVCGGGGGGGQGDVYLKSLYTCMPVSFAV